MNSEGASPEERQSLAGLRSAALLAVVIGGIGSIGLLRHAEQHPPPMLAVLFIIWVFAPFAALGLANLFSPRWQRPVRLTLYVVTLLVTAASLAIYIDNNIARRTAHPAGVWVAVPPASVIISIIAIAVGALIAKRKKT
jgi:hypothetical protein